jgi:hypothetical protein
VRCAVEIPSLIERKIINIGVLHKTSIRETIHHSRGDRSI